MRPPTAMINDSSAEDKEKVRRCFHETKKFTLRYVMPMMWLIGGFILFCMANHLIHKDINKDDRFYYLRKMLGEGLCISRATAPVINFSAVLIILPVCKTFNKFVHKVLGRLSIQLLAWYLEKLKVIHQCLAVTLVFTSVIHSVAHFVNAINFLQHYEAKTSKLNWAKDEKDNILRLTFLTPVGFSGWTMMACLVIIWTFSTRQMREYFYNSFRGVHHLFLLFYVMMYYHPVSNIIKYQDNLTESPNKCDAMERLNTSQAEIFMRLRCKAAPTFTVERKNVCNRHGIRYDDGRNVKDCKNIKVSDKSTTFNLFQYWIWPSIALLIFLLDLVFRYFKRFFTRIKAISMTLPTKDAIFLTFRVNGNISIQPGQFVLLQCENLSTIEWHPFTIIDFVSEPNRTTFTLAISVRGDWTGELYEKIFNLKMHSEMKKRRKSKSQRRKRPPRKLNFFVDGPFPSPMESILAHKRVVLIGAGIGVTPFVSIFNYIMKTTKTLTLKRIHLVWISRDIKQFTLFAEALCDLTQMFWNDNQPDRLQIRFYVTSSTVRSIAEDGDDDEEALRTPSEMFGKNSDFVLSRMYAGEPNWNFLFNFWSSLYGKHQVNVFSCAPKSMNKDIERVCSQYNRKGFDFHFLHEALS